MKISLIEQRGIVQAAPETPPVHSHSAPSQSERIFDISTDAIQRLGRAANDTCILPYPYSTVFSGMQKILPYMPVIETLATQPPTTESITPHVQDIKKFAAPFVPGLKTADTLTRHIPPLRRRLDERVVRTVLQKLPEAQAQAHEKLASVQDEVKFLAAFESTREQFVQEVNTVARKVGAAILLARDERVETAMPPAPPPPRGILGIATKVVRGVQKFFKKLFGFGRKKPEVTEVSAYDASRGIAQVLGDLNQPSQVQQQELPLLQRYIAPQLSRLSHMPTHTLALAAPELLNFIYSLSSDDATNTLIRREVLKNPHELRFVTNFKRTFGRYNLDRMQRASQTLLPAIRDILPTNSTQLRVSFEQLQRLFDTESSQATALSNKTHEAVANKPPHRQPLKVALKRLFGPEPRPASDTPKKPSFYRKTREVLKTGELPRQPWRVVRQRLFGK